MDTVADPAQPVHLALYDQDIADLEAIIKRGLEAPRGALRDAAARVNKCLQGSVSYACKRFHDDGRRAGA